MTIKKHTDAALPAAVRRNRLKGNRTLPKTAPRHVTGGQPVFGQTSTSERERMVQRYAHTPAHAPVTCALLLDHMPLCFIDVVPQHEPIDDQGLDLPMLLHAQAAGVAIYVLTNGDDWRFFNTDAQGSVGAEPFLTVRISDDAPLADKLEMLQILSPERLRQRMAGRVRA